MVQVLMIFGLDSDEGQSHGAFLCWLNSLPGVRVQCMAWDRSCFDWIKAARLAGVPLVIIGHSFGGDKAVEVAKALGWAVDHLVLLDPVHRPLHGWGSYTIPDNVRAATCWYNPDNATDRLPLADPHAIANTSAAFVNVVMGIAHGSFVDNAQIQAGIGAIVAGLNRLGVAA